MASFILLSATLLSSLVASIPLQASPSIADDIPSLNGTAGIPYFGHFKGNFQPESKSSFAATVVNSAEGVWTIVNKDSIGEGSNVYRQY